MIKTIIIMLFFYDKKHNYYVVVFFMIKSIIIMHFGLENKSFAYSVNVFYSRNHYKLHNAVSDLFNQGS